MSPPRTAAAGWRRNRPRSAAGAVNRFASHSFQKNMSARTTVCPGLVLVITRVRCPDPPQRSSTRPGKAAASCARAPSTASAITNVGIGKPVDEVRPLGIGAEHRDRLAIRRNGLAAEERPEGVAARGVEAKQREQRVLVAAGFERLHRLAAGLVRPQDRDARDDRERAALAPDHARLDAAVDLRTGGHSRGGGTPRRRRGSAGDPAGARASAIT